jgi:outer membrane lipoprotein-sorting protein
MKTFIVLCFLVSTSAFAEGNEIVQALLDNNAKISEIQTSCASGVQEVTTKSVKQGVWNHTIQLGRRSRGESKPGCEITIVQDYTPTYHDGGIAYKISVKNSK